MFQKKNSANTSSSTIACSTSFDLTESKQNPNISPFYIVDERRSNISGIIPAAVKNQCRLAFSQRLMVSQTMLRRLQASLVFGQMLLLSPKLRQNFDHPKFNMKTKDHSPQISKRTICTSRIITLCGAYC
jgi:hypothetical protein